MTRTIAIVQVGIGRVGGAVVSLVAGQASLWHARYGVDVRYYAVADSTAFAVADNMAGSLPAEELPEPIIEALARRQVGERLVALAGAEPFARWERILSGALAHVSAPADLVVLDCAAGAETTPLLLAARAAGAHVVLANKDPLVGPYSQFNALSDGGAGGSLRISATVGAGLPVLASLRRLVATGDTLRLLSARASGSLGFLCDRLSNGVSFDIAVREAEASGYTEPDPRQDLSGFDAARKLLILARVAGYHDAELSDVTVESLVPPGAEALTTEQFLATLPAYATFLSERVAAVRADNKVLRYVARIAPRDGLSARLLDLAPDDPLAQGRGPDNVFIVHTTRYSPRPLIIAGPGAGVPVTAGAVFADLLQAIGAL